MTRVLETVLTGRNLLSPMLATASRDVVAFNAQMATAQGKASVSAATSAQVQDRAADKIAASNVKASTSASASSQAQTRAHTRAAESATASARVQEAANRSLATSNGLLGSSLTPVTARLGATGLALAYAGYRGMEFGSAMSQVQASTQANAATMNDLSDAALEWGAKTQYSSVEAAQGITEMAKAGVATTDILQGGLAGALNLAAAGQMEVADAAEIGATAMNVFNLEGDQMSHVADLLAAGAGKAQGSVYDLGQALNQSALVASATGLSIEETAGSLALFASQGLVGSDAGTSFRQMLLHLQNPSKEAAGVMADLGVNMYDANGAFVGMEDLAGQLQTRMSGLTQQQRDQAMATIFGADAVRASNILYEAGSAGVEEWTGKVNDAGYAAKQAAQLNDNLRGDLERLGGAFDSVMTTIGSGSQGALREVVQALTAIVEVGGDVIGFWNDLPGPVQAGVAAYAAFAMLRNPVSDMLASLASRMIRAEITLRAATGATTMWTTSLAAARIGVVSLISAAAPLAAAIGIAYAVSEVINFDSATDDARESVEKLGESVKDLPVGEQIKTYREEIESLQEKIDSIEGQGLFDKYVWQNPFNDQFDDMEQYQESIELIQARIESLKDTTPSSMETVTDAVKGAATATVEQSEEAQKALEDWLEAVQDIEAGFIDPLATYQGLLEAKTTAEREAAEATAAATESGTDSWEDYVTDVSVSLDELATKLEEQLLAQDNWHANLATVAQRAGLDVAQALQQMGEDGVQLTAQMANGTDAEMQRMADLIREDARRGGTDAAAALDNGLKVMAIVGRDGAKATRSGIAEELGIGVGEVQDIFDKYGVAVATGINPILTALGKRMVGVQRDFKNQRNLWTGGYTGDGGKYEPKGVVHGGEIVWSQEDIAAHGGVSSVEQMRTSRPKGYATGGFVSADDVPRPYSTAPYSFPISTPADAAMQKGFDEVRAWLTANAEATQGGTAGAGAVGGAWGSLWQLVKGQIPQARINSTFRAGDPGKHGENKAVDFGFGSGPGGAGSAGLASINRLLHDQVGRNLYELIYDGIGDDRPDLKNGKPLTYSAATRAEHRNHVHAAVRDNGGLLPSGISMVGNFTGGTENLAVFTDQQWDTLRNVAAAMPGYGMGGNWGGGGGRGSVNVAAPNVTVKVLIDGQEFRGMARIEVDHALGEQANYALYNQ